jgi:hypothetical protein
MIIADQTLKLEELIDKYEHLKKDLVPAEEKLNAELAKIRLQILDRARARTSFTGDPLKDLSIFKFGNDFKDNYDQLVRLREVLKNAANEFILIHDTSYHLLINKLKERDRCYIPFRVASLGIIDSNPLEVGYEYDIAGDKYYLKLRFQNGSYIRELDVKEEERLDKWFNIIPTFRGRGESYTENTELLTFITPSEDYKSSDDYIRHLYIEGEWEEKPKPKKPYWRIAPNKFDTNTVKIGAEPVIEIIEKQEFPEKENKVFALYIGNQEVMMRSGLDLKELNTLQKVYDKLNSARGKPGALSLVF